MTRFRHSAFLIVLALAACSPRPPGPASSPAQYLHLWTGQLALDERFREEGATEPGFRMDNKTWPHGGAAKGIPHGAVFSRPLGAGW